MIISITIMVINKTTAEDDQNMIISHYNSVIRAAINIFESIKLQLLTRVIIARGGERESF